MSDLLASLGPIHDAQLAAEQLGKMESLYRDLPRGSDDRLPVAVNLAEMHWSYAIQESCEPPASLNTSTRQST